ncbi:MAG TPA: hypothetical protein H9794_02645 [Candidatus Mediterraneibacter merdigallinarum]|nr:hypothetical protein [Candidatus Mediterraneibacter merdigallinarum]
MEEMTVRSQIVRALQAQVQIVLRQENLTADREILPIAQTVIPTEIRVTKVRAPMTKNPETPVRILRTGIRAALTERTAPAATVKKVPKAVLQVLRAEVQEKTAVHPIKNQERKTQLPQGKTGIHPVQIPAENPADI